MLDVMLAFGDNVAGLLNPVAGCHKILLIVDAVAVVLPCSLMLAGAQITVSLPASADAVQVDCADESK